MTIDYAKAAVWFPNLMKVMSGLPAVHNWPKPAPQWALQEHKEFELWNQFKSGQFPVRRDGWPLRIPLDHWPAIPIQYTAWELRTAFLKAHHVETTKPQPVPTPISAKILPESPTKGRLVLYFYDAINFNGGNVKGILEINDQHPVCVILYVFSKTDLANDGGNPFTNFVPPGWRETLQKAGIPVLASGWIEAGQMQAQAKFAVSASKGFDGIVFDVEDGWGFWDGKFPQVTEQDGTVLEVSESFCKHLRAEDPKMPLLCTPMWGEQLHLKPWIESGFVQLLPQSYTSLYPWMTLASGVEHGCQPQGDLPGGLAPSGITPLASAYDLSGGTPPPSFYAQGLKELALRYPQASRGMWPTNKWTVAQVKEFASY